MLEAIYHVVEHFSLHLGQIVLLAKLHTPGAIEFYEDAGGLARPVWMDMMSKVIDAEAGGVSPGDQRRRPHGEHGGAAREFEALGLKDVETFIASGNVIFTAPPGSRAALERKIERHLHGVLGYEVKTFLRTEAEVAAIAGYKPFSDAEDSRGAGAERRVPR